MNKSEQYEYFQSLIKTCNKLDKAIAKDKTTDEIISDISDPDSKPSVIPHQGNPTSVPLAKGANPKAKNKEKGVHQPYLSQGQSLAGELSREGKEKPGKFGEQNKEVGREFHSNKLKELKDIKPNLPKSEEMNKGDKKGIHTQVPVIGGGQSKAGIKTRVSNITSRMGQEEKTKQAKEKAKESHKKVLNEMKEMPKPNLPKSEEMDKSDKKNVNTTLNKFKRFMKKKTEKKQSK